MEDDIGPDESVSSAVVRAVSAARGCHPRALQPLEDVCDPDALDSLFDSKDDGTPRTGGRLAFVFSDYHVTIDNGEYLTIEPLENRLLDDPASEFTDGRDR